MCVHLRSKEVVSVLKQWEDTTEKPAQHICTSAAEIQTTTTLTPYLEMQETLILESA